MGKTSKIKKAVGGMFRGSSAPLDDLGDQNRRRREEAQIRAQLALNDDLRNEDSKRRGLGNTDPQDPSGPHPIPRKALTYGTNNGAAQEYIGVPRTLQYTHSALYCQPDNLSRSANFQGTGPPRQDANHNPSKNVENSPEGMEMMRPHPQSQSPGQNRSLPGEGSREADLHGHRDSRGTDAEEQIFPLQGTESKQLETYTSSREEEHIDEVLKRIYQYLYKTKTEYPPIHFEREFTRPLSIEDVEMALQSVVKAFDSMGKQAFSLEELVKQAQREKLALQSDHEDDMKRTRTEFNERISTLERERNKLQGNNDYFKGKLEAVKEDLAITERKHSDRLKEIRMENQREKDALVRNYAPQVQRLEGEVQRLKNLHQSEIQRLTDQHLDQWRDREKATSEELAKLKSICEKQLNQAQETNRYAEEGFNSRIKTMSSQYEEKMRREKADFSIQLSAMQDQVNKAVKKMAKEIQTTESKCAADMENMKVAYQLEKDAWTVDLARKEEEHKQEKVKLFRELKEENQALKGALVRRDHFKPLSDHELAQRFQDIGTEIDDLARVTWDTAQQSNWPFPDQDLRNSENVRRTKQHIIQNSIWVILYEKIFSTPFRVLGSEGKALEGQWIEKYGQDRTSDAAVTPWPRPTKDSEKWRYETMKQFAQITSQPLLESDSKYNVKRDYESSLEETTEAIKQEIDLVASVNGSEKQRMSALVKKAAKLWLEVGQQRCRMFLLMSESGNEPVRSRRTNVDADGTLALVVIPELRRMGNAQGERLESNELVMDCKGKFSVFYSNRRR